MLTFPCTMFAGSENSGFTTLSPQIGDLNTIQDVIKNFIGFSGTIRAEAPISLGYTDMTIAGTDYVLAKGMNQVVIMDGFSNKVKSSWTYPPTTLRGITWDGSNLITSDNTTIRKHSGITSAVTNFFTNVGIRPTALAWDGASLISNEDSSSPIIRKYVAGFSSLVASSFTINLGGICNSIEWYNGNLYLGSGTFLRQYNGFSSNQIGSVSNIYGYTIYGMVFRKS